MALTKNSHNSVTRCEKWNNKHENFYCSILEIRNFIQCEKILPAIVFKIGFLLRMKKKMKK